MSLSIDRTRAEHRSTITSVATLAAATSAVAALAWLADGARDHNGPSRLDPPVAAEVLHLRTPLATLVAHLFSFVGSEIVVGSAAVALLAGLLWQRLFARAIPFAVAMAGSAILTVTLKLLVARHRPGAADRLGPVDPTYSFPSGHTLNSTVLIALIVWLLWTRSTALGRMLLVECGALVALGIAASRIYLGYHWLTDVLASFLVATAWLGLVALGWRFVSAHPRPPRRPAEVPGSTGDREGQVPVR